MTIDTFTAIDQLEQFLTGAEIYHYQPLDSKDDRYTWLQKTLIQFRYTTLGKREKGIVIRYLIKISGYSRQQMTRLIRHYIKTEKCVQRQRSPKGFARRFWEDDIRLLAELDAIHERPCGAVIKQLCERLQQTNDPRHERLVWISMSHIYNLRRSYTYQRTRRQFTKTKSKAKKSTIGELRKSFPQDQPGYLRVDTVHQGDQDKRKGCITLI
ncbi:MAG: hypothetical protein ACI9Y1_002954 [Lentisphaeria bacterium]|jgi:hypothetical protein